MKIDRGLRILTIGDGDGSFSYSIHKHYSPADLVCTVYDSHDELTAKYGDEFIQLLRDEKRDVFFNLDVEETNRLPPELHRRFDIVLFQFPLKPNWVSREAFLNQKYSTNIANRALLRHFLINCFDFFLATDGKRLAVITSKDVKPYSEWNIESALTINTKINYVGCSKFLIEDFPGYQVRNVDRDKFVKETNGISYGWTDSELLDCEESFHKPKAPESGHCVLCRTGQFQSTLDEVQHLRSKKHLRMQQFELEWHEYLRSEKSKRNLE